MIIDFGSDLINFVNVSSVHVRENSDTQNGEIQILSDSNVYTFNYNNVDEAKQDYYLLIRKYKEGANYIKLTPTLSFNNITIPTIPINPINPID